MLVLGISSGLSTGIISALSLDRVSRVLALWSSVERSTVLLGSNGLTPPSTRLMTNGVSGISNLFKRWRVFNFSILT